MKFHPITGKQLFPITDPLVKAQAVKNVKITMHFFPR